MIEEIKKYKIISILRNVDSTYILDVADALYKGGIRFLEITTNGSGTFDSIKKLRSLYDGKMYIGCGTVTTLMLAEKAIDAGSEFIVTPNLSNDVVKYCLKHNTPIFPGVMTPSEIVNAMSLGVEAVKLFPASSLGLNYIKEIQGPLADVPLIATGGITLDNVKDYLKAGCIGFGIGSSLLDKTLIQNKKFEELEMLAKEFCKQAQVTRH